MTQSTEFVGPGCRTALVTGGSSGLGLAMAAALAGADERIVATEFDQWLTDRRKA
jgi:NAD(P)-dependent dehydrogenase (short-subunit alcohol dehydrogenase family)